MMDDPVQPRIVEDRAVLRREWRADDRQMIVWTASDYPQAADAAAALVAVGLAAETGRPFRLLLHPEAPGVDRVRRMTEAMGCPDRLIVDERAAEPWRIVRAVDVALAMGGHCQRAIRWAMAGGLPIVADKAAGGVIPAGRPRLLSAALIRLTAMPPNPIDRLTR